MAVIGCKRSAACIRGGREEWWTLTDGRENTPVRSPVRQAQVQAGKLAKKFGVPVVPLVCLTSGKLARPVDGVSDLRGLGVELAAMMDGGMIDPAILRAIGACRTGMNPDLARRHFRMVTR